MFGKNPIRKQDLSSPGTLYVQELFSTIQGEGPFQGTPCVFIRLWGCNLKCFWCDTDFESNPEPVDVPIIMSRVKDAFLAMGKIRPGKRPLVVITGGEPFRQDLTALLNRLSHEGFLTQIETNGTLWIEGFEVFIAREDLVLVCSPKTGKIHKMINEWCDHWKYIIDADHCSPDDGLPMVSTQVENTHLKIFKPPEIADTIWVQPLDMDHVDFNITTKNLQHTAAIAMKYGYRLCLQQHKIIGLP